ncbi:pentatricopeptide repeat (PPR) superfamily protein [Striga asiatica]|uniref:Pentatricopeptide repeat (PPR) superfamily protein n=1 Tax=Striga asiatica TaxID=4170 RepID=A0A5A7PLV6_STRAF|nr:pentatricopeptide repeat (PPR) superfamily protein [Striga asiatica]
MESIIKKYQQKFKRLKDDMSRWEELQSRLLIQFSNASSIIQRLQLIENSSNYGALKCVEGIERAVLAKQMESLQIILTSMNKTMEEFHGVVSSIQKTVRDSKQLVKVGSSQMTSKQLKQQVGVKPTPAYCLEGLGLLEEMHQSEYLLKLSLVSALPALALKPSANDDLGALQQLLVDQPNIPLQLIYDIVFAEEIA